MPNDENALEAAYPKVAVLWLNYNSMHVIETTKKSLASLLCLDYPNFEVVLADNGSTDGSREAIEEFFRAQTPRKVAISFVKLSRNLGWADGVNAAYKARDREAKYVALTHNDIVAERGYLRAVVGYMERHREVGAAQGIVTRLGDRSKVDSAGFMLDEALDLFRLSESGDFSLKKPLRLSYVEGAMPVYNVDAVKSAVKGENELFVAGAFMYYLEDVFVSVELWSRGYQCVFLPIITGEHLRMAVSALHAEPLSLAHYRIRNQVALLCMTNSADKLRFYLQNLRRAAVSRGSFAFRQMMLRSLVEGTEMGGRLRARYGVIDLYKTPMRRTSVKNRFRI